MYDEWLDEQGPILIGTLEYSASWVLKQVDEIAYNMGLDEFIADIEYEYWENRKHEVDVDA